MRNFLKPAVLVLIAALASPAMATTSVPANGHLGFDVIRKGKDIGDYTISFRQSGKNLTVNIVTDVAVKLPLIRLNAYVFRQNSRETWQNGRLSSLVAKTDDNGTDHNFKMGASSILPASLWNAKTISATKVVNTIDGKLMSIRVRKIGTEAIATGHGSINADHYRIEGGLARDVWYAADGTLAKVAFTGDDGSRVEYRLR